MKKILKKWLSNKIPDHYLQIKITGNGFFKDIKSLLLFYFIHPIKRRIARNYCIFLKKHFGLKVIAITGSSGKSTTKEMIASILKINNNTIYSYANIDPFYNIPSTILKCNFKTKYLILEFGVEYPGEMDFYLWMVKPDMGIITSINPTHTQFFKSTEGVFQEKIKMANFLLDNGKIILNKENEYLRRYGIQFKDKVIFYGKDSPFSADDIKIIDTGNTSYLLNFKNKKVQIDLGVLGEVNVNNSLAAIAVALELGINIQEIKKGLKEYRSLEHRLSLFRINKTIIIDDTYNNNPVAAKESIKLLSQLGKDKKIAIVFGDMLELGNLSKKYHEEIGEILSKLPLERIICVGKESKIISAITKNKFGSNNSIWVSNEAEVDKHISDLLGKEYIILFKASRSIGLDKLIIRLSK